MKSCAILGLNAYTSARTRHSSFCIASPAKISTLSSQDQQTKRCQFSQKKTKALPISIPLHPSHHPPFFSPSSFSLSHRHNHIHPIQPTTCPLPLFNLEIRTLSTYIFSCLPISTAYPPPTPLTHVAETASETRIYRQVPAYTFSYGRISRLVTRTMYFLIYSTSVMSSHGKWRSQPPILLAFPSLRDFTTTQY